ncbi:hypothetical protein [Rubritalea sp.]|uniref:hypothetical protein n=1 Tax=Rubritalea sp. TaxID=2109375 RepID=UPI003EF1E927
MKHIKLIVSGTLCLLMASCGHQVTASGTPISASQTKTIHLVCDRELDSQEVHNAVKKELTNSGFRVINLEDNTSAQPSGTTLHYRDEWGWDLVTLIRELDIKVVDNNRNTTLSTAHYTQLST